MPYIDVIGGVARFTVVQEWTNARPVINVLDMHIDVVGVLTSREDALLDQANVISNNWASHILPHLSDNLVMTRVDWLDLDSAGGSTGSFVPTAPQPGEEVGASASPNNALLIHKKITSARGVRAGRMYVAGVLEGDVDEDGIIAVSDYQTDVTAFLAGINQTSGIEPPNYNSELVVAHLGPHPKPIPTDPTVVDGSYTAVTDLIVDSLVATQRRRVRG